MPDKEVLRVESPDDVLRQPLKIVIGKNFHDTTVEVNGKYVPCVYMDIVVSGGNHTFITLEIIGERLVEPIEVSGILISEAEYDILKYGQ